MSDGLHIEHEISSRHITNIEVSTTIDLPRQLPEKIKPELHQPATLSNSQRQTPGG